ncbi:MAG: phage major capsid protein [Fusobacteriaceae bacterium]
MLDRIIKNDSGLIADEMSKILIEELKESSKVFELGMKVESKARKVKIPILKNSGGAVQFKNEYEGIATENIISFIDVEIVRKYLQSTIHVSDELIRDANIDIHNIIIKRATRDLSKKIENDTFAGIENIRGITQTTELVENAVIETDDMIQDLLELTTSITTAYTQQAKLYMSLEYYKKLKSLKDASGNQIVKGNMFDDRYEMIIVDVLSDSEYSVIFADISKLYCYFTDNKFEVETQYNRVEATANKVLKISIGGKVVDYKACAMLKKGVI